MTPRLRSHADRAAVATAASVESRRKAAAVRKLMREGKLDADALLRGSESTDPMFHEAAGLVERWRLDRLLRAVPKIGSARTHEILVAMRLSPRVRFEQLTPRRRQELADLVAEAKGRILG